MKNQLRRVALKATVTTQTARYWEMPLTTLYLGIVSGNCAFFVQERKSIAQSKRIGQQLAGRFVRSLDMGFDAQQCIKLMARLFLSMVRIHNQLPPDGTLSHGMLMMVLWRKRFVFIRCNFALATHASIDARARRGYAWTIFRVEYFAVILAEVLAVFVQSHRGLLLCDVRKPVA
jgi:hypothetical protein